MNLGTEPPPLEVTLTIAPRDDPDPDSDVTRTTPDTGAVAEELCVGVPDEDDEGEGDSGEDGGVIACMEVLPLLATSLSE